MLRKFEDLSKPVLSTAVTNQTLNAWLIGGEPVGMVGTKLGEQF